MKRKSVRILLSLSIVVLAVVLVLFKYRHYLNNPWTRNGQVRAQVIQITARVTGPITSLPIVDNQFVNKGDVLFEIDPRTFQANLEQAIANLDSTKDNIKALEKQVEAATAAVGEIESRIKQADSTIRAYRANREDACKTFERVDAAAATGAISQKDLDEARAAMNIAIAQYEKAVEALIETRASLVQAEAERAKAEADLGAQGEGNAKLRAAKAAVAQAQLDLEFTKVLTPVDGYVTNLNLRLGSQAVANQPALALVDTDSFWIHGFFREDVVGDINPGDQAVVTLMSYPDLPLEGRVDSIGWGIAQDDGSTGQDLLPNISPTFEWIRLAQRVPVRVHLENVPDEVKLRVGTTGSVLVKKRSSDQDEAATVPPVSKALQ
jgi:multidrug resistance efflux pump